MLRDLLKQKSADKTGKKPELLKIRTGLNRAVKKNTKKEGGKGKGAALLTPEVPDDCYRKCNVCGKAILNMDVKENLSRCPKCGAYFRMHAGRRIAQIADAGSFEAFCENLPPVNPLQFPGYEEKLREQREGSGLSEAVVTGLCRIEGERAVLAVMDSRFIMSSMGYNVGELITRAIEAACREQLPLVMYCCSGGARMQEGIISLMQMQKTAQALKKHHEMGLLSINVLTNPTTGGVTASFAMLSDIILAEPGALIGFAGPRVIEQTIRQKLPEGFQRAEFLLEHGFLDRIVKREEQKPLIARLLRLHRTGKELEKEREAFFLQGEQKLCKEGSGEGEAAERPGKTIEKGESKEPAKGSAKALTDAWERVLCSRKAERPRALQYIEALFDDFIELHGDRLYGDDKAIVGGIASFHGLPVTVIAQQKGRTVKENLERNFGMPYPEGYRKALRLMREANAFGRPVICFVDTPGAYPGIVSEERGQGEAIARCLYEMSGFTVPIISIVLSEGGSGGALALAAANEVYMLENATYSILSPEGFASILYKDAKRAKEAAGIMKITAAELYELGVIDGIIGEGGEACGETLPLIAEEMEAVIFRGLSRMKALAPAEIAEKRYEKFRNL